MANVNFAKAFPSSMTAARALWLPELSVRLWRAAHSAIMACHNPTDVGGVSLASIAGSSVTWGQIDVVWPDSWSLDTTLATNLGVELGVYITAESTTTRTDFEFKIGTSGQVNTVSLSAGVPSTFYITRKFTGTLPTGHQSYDLIVGGGSGNITVSRPNNDHSDVYIMFVES